MKRLLFFAVVVLLPYWASGQNFEWAKAMGGSSNEVGNSVAVDALGNVYTTGYFQGTVDFDPGTAIVALSSTSTNVSDPDIFISKLDPNGNFVWAKALGGIMNDQGISIAVDASGNVYTIGVFQGTVDFDPGAGTSNLTAAGNFDVFISKLDTDGDFLWAGSIGGTASRALCGSITLDMVGNLYFTGSFSNIVDFNPNLGVFNATAVGTEDIFVCKLDTDGDFLWVKTMGGLYNGAGNSLTTDAAGNVYSTGYFKETVDFDPGVGVFNLSASSTFGDAFILKLDASGNFIWAKAMAGWGSGRSIAVDSEGNVYATGLFLDAVDFDPGLGVFNLMAVGTFADVFISKLDVNGNFVWARAIGGVAADIGSSLTLDGVGNVYITGRFLGTVDFDPGGGVFSITSFGLSDIFVLKLAVNGNFIWATTMGGTNEDESSALTIDAMSNVYITGFFEGLADFDPSPNTFNLTALGFVDIFILKLSPTSTSISNDLAPFPLSIYPNPSTGRFVIEGEPQSLGVLHISVYNSLGQELIPARELTPAANWTEEIDLSTQLSGIYHLRITNGHATFSRQLVVVQR